MKRSLLAGVGVFIGAAAAAGLVARALASGSDPDRESAVAFVRSVGDEIAHGRFDLVWTALDDATQDQFTRTHSALLDGVRSYGRPEQHSERAAIKAQLLRLTAEEHGLTPQEILATTAVQFWSKRTADNVHGDEARLAFAHMDVQRVRIDGRRGAVDVVLGDHRTQGFPLVRRADGRWALVDFQAYYPSDAYRVASSMPTPAKAAVPPAEAMPVAR